jgi:uncharacterized protein
VSSAPFHVMTKPTGPICNLDCKYCFYLEKESLYSGTKQWAMQPEVLESYIRQYIESQPTETVSFAWQGGEPTLMGVDFFLSVVELQAKYANGKKIENALQTNGILLDDTWGQFLSEHHFLVGLSIDGPRRFHDAYRLDKGGQPTFTRVIRGMEVLKRHAVEFNALTVVNRKNSYYPLEVYRFLRRHGSGYIQFIPIVERVAHSPLPDGLTMVGPAFDGYAAVSEWSVEPEEFGRFLCAIFDEWVRNDVGTQFVQLFDVALESWLGMEASLCIFRERCGSAMALEHNGDLYSCDHFVDRANRLGNVIESPLASLASSARQKRFGDAKNDLLPQYCRNCEVRFACNGECPKNRFTQTPTGEAGLNYLCAGYKMFFNHIDPYMRYMANELRNHRPPANVMAWARTRRGTNENCGCASEGGIVRPDPRRIP